MPAAYKMVGMYNSHVAMRSKLLSSMYNIMFYDVNNIHLMPQLASGFHRIESVPYLPIMTS